MATAGSFRFDQRQHIDATGCPDNIEELRELALWYREFADRAGNPAIWEARLLTGQELDDEADRLEAELLGARTAERA